MFTLIRRTQTLIEFSKVDDIVLKSQEGVRLQDPKSGRDLYFFKEVMSGKEHCLMEGQFEVVDQEPKYYEMPVDPSYRDLYALEEGEKTVKWPLLHMWCEKCGNYVGQYNLETFDVIPFCKKHMMYVSYADFDAGLRRWYVLDQSGRWYNSNPDWREDNYHDGMYNAHERTMERLNEKWEKEAEAVHARWLCHINGLSFEDVFPDRAQSPRDIDELEITPEDLVQ